MTTKNSTDINEDSAAEDTLHPNAGSGSKAEVMQSLVNAMAGMSVQDLSDLFNRVQADIGNEAKGIPDGVAGSNRASVAMKPSYATEDLLNIFSGQELSEEFKTKTTTLFEAAVGVAVEVEKQKLEEEYEAAILEQVEELTSGIDEYLEYAVTEWLKENEIEATSALKQDINDEFLEGLKDLFKEHYIDIPEERVDVVEELVSKLNVLEEKLNLVVEENISLNKIVSEAEKVVAFEEVTEGLTETQIDKVRQLAESVSYSDLEEFKSKVKILTESVNPAQKKPVSGILNEELQISENNEIKEVKAYLEPQIGNYVKAISRTAKN